MEEASFQMEEDVDATLFHLFTHVEFYSGSGQTDFPEKKFHSKLQDIAELKSKTNHTFLREIQIPLVRSFGDDRIFEAIQKRILQNDIHSTFLFLQMDTGRSDTRELLKKCFLEQQRSVALKFRKIDFTKAPRSKVVPNLLLEIVKLGYQSSLLEPWFSERSSGQVPNVDHYFPLFPGLPFRNIVHRIESVLSRPSGNHARETDQQKNLDFLRSFVLNGADPVSVVVFGAYRQLHQWVQKAGNDHKERKARSKFLAAEGQFIWFLGAVVESLGNPLPPSVQRMHLDDRGNEPDQTGQEAKSEEEERRRLEERKQAAAKYLETLPFKKKTERGAVWRCLTFLFPGQVKQPGICRDRFIREPGKLMREFLKPNIQSLKREVHVVGKRRSCLPVDSILTDLYLVAGKRFLAGLASTTTEGSHHHHRRSGIQGTEGSPGGPVASVVPEVASELNHTAVSGGMHVVVGRSAAEGNGTGNEEEQYEVEEIQESRITRDGKLEYFVKWKEYDDDQSSWEPESNFKQAKKAVAAFVRKQEANKKKGKNYFPFAAPKKARSRETTAAKRGDTGRRGQDQTRLRRGRQRIISSGEEEAEEKAEEEEEGEEEGDRRKRRNEHSRSIQNFFSGLRSRYFRHLPDGDGFWIRVDPEETASGGDRGSQETFVLQETLVGVNHKFKVRKETSTVESQTMVPIRRIARFWTLDSVNNFDRKFMIFTGRMKHKDRVRVPISAVLTEHWTVRVVELIEKILLCGVRATRGKDPEAVRARLAMLTKIFLLCPINNISQTVRDCPVYTLSGGDPFPGTQTEISEWFELEAKRKEFLHDDAAKKKKTKRNAARTEKQWIRFIILIQKLAEPPPGEHAVQWKICVLFRTVNVVVSANDSSDSTSRQQKKQVLHERFGRFFPHLPSELISNLRSIQVEAQTPPATDVKYTQVLFDMINFVSRHGLWYPFFRRLGAPKPPSFAVSVATVSRRNREPREGVNEPVGELSLGHFPWHVERDRIVDTVLRSSVFGEHLLPTKNSNARADMYLKASKSLGEIRSVLNKPLFQEEADPQGERSKNLVQQKFLFFPVYR